MSDSLWPHGLQHIRLPCPSLSPGVCSNSRPLSQWCHPAISFLLPTSTPALNLFQNQGLFQWVSYLHQVAKVLELKLQHQSSNKYSGLISFRIDWFDLLAVQGTQESFPVPQFGSINSLALNLFYGSTFTSVHDYWKNHSFDYTDLCWQNDVSVF